jgi:anti-sigma factor RsiW
MNKKALRLLYRSFDIDLTPEEKSELETALRNSPQLKEERKRIVAMRQTVSAGAAKSFGPFFAERVMHAITSVAEKRNGVETFFASLQFTFRRVALVGAVAIFLLLVYNFAKSGYVSVEAAFGMPQETLTEVLESPFNATLEELL